MFNNYNFRTNEISSAIFSFIDYMCKQCRLIFTDSQDISHITLLNIDLQKHRYNIFINLLAEEQHTRVKLFSIN